MHQEQDHSASPTGQPEPRQYPTSGETDRAVWRRIRRMLDITFPTVTSIVREHRDDFPAMQSPLNPTQNDAQVVIVSRAM
jgi:hypothetical protein